MATGVACMSANGRTEFRGSNDFGCKLWISSVLKGEKKKTSCRWWHAGEEDNLRKWFGVRN